VRTGPALGHNGADCGLLGRGDGEALPVARRVQWVVLGRHFTETIASCGHTAGRHLWLLHQKSNNWPARKLTVATGSNRCHAELHRAPYLTFISGRLFRRKRLDFGLN
jgi:hypothetical protein